MGNPERVEKIQAHHQQNKIEGKACPELIIINATPKKAASTYQSCKYDFSFEMSQDWDIDMKFDLDIGKWDFGDLNIE